MTVSDQVSHILSAFVALLNMFPFFILQPSIRSEDVHAHPRHVIEVCLEVGTRRKERKSERGRERERF